MQFAWFRYNPTKNQCVCSNKKKRGTQKKTDRLKASDMGEAVNGVQLADEATKKPAPPPTEVVGVGWESENPPPTIPGKARNRPEDIVDHQPPHHHPSLEGRGGGSLGLVGADYGGEEQNTAANKGGAGL